MVNRSYDQWSDEVLRAWTGEDHRELDDFLAANASMEADGTKVIAAFRRFLAARVMACKPHISPSSFMLSVDGKRRLTRKQSADELLTCGTLVGLNEESEFAPLPAAVREQLPAVTGKMQSAYSSYRTKVVDPVFDDLKRCDRLIVLIDVPFLLAAGHETLNDCHKMLESILVAARHNWNLATDIPKGLVNTVNPFATTRFGGVTKIAFVATKNDLVARSDQNALLSLLQEMIAALGGSLDGIEHCCFTASAVVSTGPTDLQDNERVGHLSGRLKYDMTQDPPRKMGPDQPPTGFLVSRLPDKWPNRWRPGQFFFPEVHPDMPAARFACPEHNSLDQVLGYVLS